MAGEEDLMKQVEELKRRVREVEKEKDEMRRGLEEEGREARRGREETRGGEYMLRVLEGLRAGQRALQCMWNNKVRKTTI